MTNKPGLRLESGLAEAEVMWNSVERFEIQKDLALISAAQISPTKASFTFRAAWSRIEFELTIALDGDEIIVGIPWNSIREPRGDVFRLFGVRPLAGLLTTRETILAPLRSGALVHVAPASPAGDRPPADLWPTAPLGRPADAASCRHLRRLESAASRSSPNRATTTPSSKSRSDPTAPAPAGSPPATGQLAGSG